MSEILQRLRAVQSTCTQYVAGSDIMREAADEIERLAARLAEAQEELAQWRATGESVTRNEHALSARLSNLRKWALDGILLPEELEAIESGDWWESKRE